MGPLGITHVGACLVGDGDGVDGDQGGVGKYREQGRKDVEDVHCCFGEHEKHGEDGDDKVEVGYADFCLSKTGLK